MNWPVQSLFRFPSCNSFWRTRPGSRFCVATVAFDVLTEVSVQVSVFWVVTACCLVMEAVSTPETSVNFYLTTRRYNPEDSHLVCEHVLSIWWAVVRPSPIPKLEDSLFSAVRDFLFNYRRYSGRPHRRPKEHRVLVTKEQTDTRWFLAGSATCR
jgi:hypothetical protein